MALESILGTKLEGRKRLVFRWSLAYVALLVVSSYVFFELLSGSENVQLWQNAVAWMAFGTLLFALVAANSYLKFDATEESERRHLRAIRPQLVNAKPTTLTISREGYQDSLTGYHDTIVGLFDGEKPAQTTVRDSLAEFRESWRSQTRRFPSLAVKLTYEAVLILVFGAIVVVPVSWWSGGEVLSFGGGLAWIGSVLWAVVTAFPASDALVGLVLAIVLSVGDVLFEFWFGLSVLLFTGAAVITYLEYITDEELTTTLYPNRKRLALRMAMWGGLIWVAGAGFGLIHGYLGVAAAVLVAGFATISASVGLIGRLFDAAGMELPFRTKQYDPETIAGAADADLTIGPLETDPVVAAEELASRLDAVDDGWRGRDGRPEVAAYLVARKAFALLGVACLPILVAYVALAFGTGQFFAVGIEIATSPWHIRVPVLVIVLAALALIKANYPDLTDELLEAARRAMSSSLVRGFLFARGVPVLAIAVGFAVAWPFASEAGVGAWAALLVGLLAGALARLGTLAWQASKYRFVDFADRETGRSEVVVEAFTLEDADGVPIYVARVDGHELAHRDRDVLASVVLKEVRERFETGETPPSFANYYYEEAIDHGHVDIQFVADEYTGDIKTRIEATLREADGRLEVEKMDKEMCEEYAEPAYKKAVRWLMVHGDLDIRRGKYVLH